MRIKNRIAVYLKASGMTQAKLSETIGISTVAINRWCKGHNNPERELHQKLADILKVSVKELFYLDQDEQSSPQNSESNNGSQTGSRE